jgi:hypothetical protein
VHAHMAGDSSTSPGGCAHYDRSCKILAPCCGEWFWCATSVLLQPEACSTLPLCCHSCVHPRDSSVAVADRAASVHDNGILQVPTLSQREARQRGAGAPPTECLPTCSLPVASGTLRVCTTTLCCRCHLALRIDTCLGMPSHTIRMRVLRRSHVRARLVLPAAIV